MLWDREFESNEVGQSKLERQFLLPSRNIYIWTSALTVTFSFRFLSVVVYTMEAFRFGEAPFLTPRLVAFGSGDNRR